VTTLTDVSYGVTESDQLMTDYSVASDQISHAPKEQNFVVEEISSSIVRLYDFLLNKNSETKAI
jgi:methyl-accepting chemotaxis protein|tara:strand:+ start:2007 stop:2198 length:192 start_codon:yes stop_codon:yes gene_type:complete